MPRGKLWEYVAMYHPKVKKDNAGNDITEPSVLIIGPTRILAVAEKEVAMKASREVPKEYDGKLDDVEILVRPF